MRKKIKQLMNKEEGFTLVELLAVIVILGIIVAIAVPSIGNIMSRAEDNAKKAEQELVVDAARLFVTERGADATVATELTDGLTVLELVKAGFLENPFSGGTDAAPEKVAGDNTSLLATNKVTVTPSTADANGFVTYTYNFE